MSRQSVMPGVCETHEGPGKGLAIVCVDDHPLFPKHAVVALPPKVYGAATGRADDTTRLDLGLTRNAPRNHRYVPRDARTPNEVKDYRERLERTIIALLATAPLEWGTRTRYYYEEHADSTGIRRTTPEARAHCATVAAAMPPSSVEAALDRLAEIAEQQAAQRAKAARHEDGTVEPLVEDVPHVEYEASRLAPRPMKVTRRDGSTFVVKNPQPYAGEAPLFDEAYFREYRVTHRGSVEHGGFLREWDGYSILGEYDTEREAFDDTMVVEGQCSLAEDESLWTPGAEDDAGDEGPTADDVLWSVEE